MPTRILTREDVRDLLTMEAAVTAVQRAFAAHGRGEAIMPPKSYIQLEHHDGDFRAMPAYLDGSAGVKWVSSHPNNPQRNGLPSVIGVYILSDPGNAMPLAILDATLMTAFRTGAAAAVASRFLAPQPETLGLIGCGAQARCLVSAHRIIFPEIEVRAADVSRQAAERVADEFGGTAVSLEEAAACDIVCTATPSQRPLVRRDWVQTGTHINAIGADAPGKQELDPRILQDARVYLDDPVQAIHSGEINVPIRDGVYTEEEIFGTLGDLVADRIPGREGAPITVFDSTGLAIQDLVLARLIYDAARDRGVGVEVELNRVRNTNSLIPPRR